MGCVGWFGGGVLCTFVVLVTRWRGGLERRFFLCDSVVQVDMFALFGLDDAVYSQFKVEGAKRHTAWCRYSRGDSGNEGKWLRGDW